MFCESCGARLTPGAAFCERCGAAVAVEPPVHEEPELQAQTQPPAFAEPDTETDVAPPVEHEPPTETAPPDAEPTETMFPLGEPLTEISPLAAALFAEESASPPPVHRSPSPPPPLPPPPPESPPEWPPHESPPPRSGGGHWGAVVGIGLVMLLVIGAVAFILSQGGGTPRTVASRHRISTDTTGLNHTTTAPAIVTKTVTIATVTTVTTSSVTTAITSTASSTTTTNPTGTSTTTTVTVPPANPEVAKLHGALRAVKTYFADLQSGDYADAVDNYETPQEQARTSLSGANGLNTTSPTYAGVVVGHPKPDGSAVEVPVSFYAENTAGTFVNQCHHFQLTMVMVGSGGQWRYSGLAGYVPEPPTLPSSDCS